VKARPLSVGRDIQTILKHAMLASEIDPERADTAIRASLSKHPCGKGGIDMGELPKALSRTFVQKSVLIPVKV